MKPKKRQEETSKRKLVFDVMKKRKLKMGRIVLAFVVGVLLLSIVSFGIYELNLGPVSKSEQEIEVVIEPGQTYLTIASILKDKKLIKSELFYKLYIKLHHPKNFEAGTYYLKPNMGVKKMVRMIEKGTTSSSETIRITFPEGKHMRAIASIISKNTDHSEDEVYEVLEDTTYLNELIDHYWFLSDMIKDKRIYYSLEGYLFPNTYEFVNIDVSVKDIFKTMLDEMEKKLEPYRKKIEESEYTVHEILTLASIVELEAAHSNDRNGVAGVFYNRLNNGWSLGSDVTTYYAEKIEMSDRDLYQSELDDVNDYNTRSSKMAGKLPIGPICNPGIDAIEAVLNPKEHNYYYFVADKNQKTYFNVDSAGHEETVAQLQKDGLWYEY